MYYFLTFLYYFSNIRNEFFPAWKTPPKWPQTFKFDPLKCSAYQWCIDDEMLSKTCFVENRQRGRFAGFSLYVSDTDVSNTDDLQKSILCYKDGPQLPPLNFTTTCLKYGRYVIFYNERPINTTYPSGYKPYNVFTDLCEVTVLGIVF